MSRRKKESVNLKVEQRKSSSLRKRKKRDWRKVEPRGPGGTASEPASKKPHESQVRWTKRPTPRRIMT